MQTRLRCDEVYIWLSFVQGEKEKLLPITKASETFSWAVPEVISLVSCKKSLDMKMSLLQLVFLPSYARMLLLPLQPCPSVVQSPWGQQDCGCYTASGSWAALVLSEQDTSKAVSLRWVGKVCREGPDRVVKLFYLVSRCPLDPVSHLAHGPGALLCALLSVSALESLCRMYPSADPRSSAQKTQQVCRIDHAKVEIALCWSQGPFKAGIIHLGDFNNTGLVSHLSYLNSLGVQPQTCSTQRN